MIILFVCDDNECPNYDIEYRFIGEDLTAECGGCHNIIKGIQTEEEVPSFDIPTEFTFG